jgi:transposase InsO family protein
MILRRNNFIINHKKIARIKREYGLITKIRRKNPYKGITLNSKEHPDIPNVLNRDFISMFPDEVYSTDMTYLFYGKCEKAYLSATKDLSTNEIVSFNLMKRPAISEFTYEFKKLMDGIPETKRKNLLIHSDQGYQYTHHEFRKVLKDAGVTQSMSRRGICLDNAPIESFFGHFKDLAEIKDCKTYEEVQKEVNRVMEYYNNERPQRALNKKPPAEYRGLLTVF